MYGVPVTAGAAFGVWPWSDSLRQTLLEQGIDYNDSVVSKTLMDGIPSMMYEMATGEQFSADRWSPKGLTIAREMYHGEKGVVETLLGASGTSVGNFLAAMEPMTMVAAEALNDSSLVVQAGSDSINQFLRNISSLNTIVQGYYGMHLGQLITKNNIVIDDMSTHQAIAKTFLGLNTRRTEETFLMLQSNKARSQTKDYAEKEAIRLYRKAWRVQKDDPKAAAEIYKQIQLVTSPLTPEEKSAILTRATRGESLFLSVGKSFSKESPERQQLFLQMLKRKGAPQEDGSR
jgi:hypothetical protein